MAGTNHGLRKYNNEFTNRAYMTFSYKYLPAIELNMFKAERLVALGNFRGQLTNLLFSVITHIQN